MLDTLVYLALVSRGAHPDLTGAWAATHAATPGPVKVLDCHPNYEHYTFARSGGRWQLHVRQVYHGGPALIYLRDERVEGAWDGAVLSLAGQDGFAVAEGVSVAYSPPPSKPVRYALARDPATGHLVGTRNGEPFRLARLILYKPVKGDCGPAYP